MAPDGAVAYREWDHVDVDPRAVDDFPRKMTALVEQHRPSRMPFFRRVAALPFAIASDPEFLGQVHLIYQSAMHATRAAVYYLPHLDSPALRKRKLQIFVDDDGLKGGDTHHYQLTRAFQNIGADIQLDDEDFGSHEELCRHLDPETGHFVRLAQKLYTRSLGPWCAVEILSVDWMKALAEGTSTKILSTPATRTVTFWINTTQPPLSDKRVRQALHYGLDVNAIIKNLYAGMGKPFSGGLADTDFGYNPALKPYPFDPALAKRLLAEAGRAGGIDVTLYAGSGTMVNDKFLLETMADMWAKVGIRAKLEMMEMGARQRMNNERTLPPHGLMLINPQSTLLDADGSLWRLFHPNGFGGKYWAGNQPGQRFHELMEQGRYTLDPAKRRQLYAEATQIVHDEKPWFELFQEIVVYGVARRLHFKARSDYRLIVAEMTLAR